MPSAAAIAMVLLRAPTVVFLHVPPFVKNFEGPLGYRDRQQSGVSKEFVSEVHLLGPRVCQNIEVGTCSENYKKVFKHMSKKWW